MLGPLYLNLFKVSSMQKKFYTHWIIVCLVSWMCVNYASAQSITTGTIATIPTGSMCPGSGVSFNVDFSTSGPAFNVGNTFSLELSNSSGTFTSGTTIIGTGTSSPIVGTIPTGTAAGSSYKVRVIGSSPVTNGSVSGTTLTVFAQPSAPTATSPALLCAPNTTPLTATGTSLTWYDASNNVLPGAPTPTATANYYVTQTNGSGCVSPKKLIEATVSTVPSAPTVTTPVALCTGATASALTATGESQATFTWYEAASGSTTISSTPSTTTAGSKSYFVSQTLNGCESTRSEIVVNVTASPAAPTVSNISYCYGATAVALTATGTGTLKWYDAATGGTGTTTAPIPTTTTAGNKSYYVTQTSGGCESPRAELVVTTNQTAAPTVTTAVAYCQNETATALTATGTDLKWYDVPSAGTALGAAPTPVTTTVGTKDYYVSQTLTTCESERAKITVTVKAPPVAPTVTPIEYCKGATAVALTATGTGTLNWYDAASGGTAGAAPVPATNVVGAKSYYVSQTVNGCEGPRAELVVTTKDTPVAPTVSNISYCYGATAVALTATGTGTLKWYDAATGGTGNASAPIPATTTAGNKSYYVTQTANGCESTRAEIVVTTNQTAAPTVTAAVSYCQNETATALTAVGTDLKWYDVPSAGTALGAAPTPVTTTVGTKDYYVSQTLTTCESERAKITVTVKALPVAPTVAPVSYCEGATATALTATGTGTLNWYAAASGGTAGAAPVPATNVVGTKSYYVSQTVNGCEGPRAEIVVTTKDTPDAPTVANVSYCYNATAVALTATGTGTLKWYDAATGGTGNASAPTPTTNVAGTKSYFVTQTTAGCESPRAEIVVTTNQTPAPVTAALTYCQKETATALTATGTALKWYTASSGGTGSTTAPIPQTDTVKTNNYYVSQTLNTCEGPRALLAVTVKALPAKPTVTDSVLNVCQNIPVAALTATGTALKWYTVATGGTSSGTAPTPVTTTAATTSYYVSQTVNGCEGPRKKIDVIVKDTPVKPVVDSILYCAGQTAVALTPSGAVYKWYTVATGGTGTTTAPTPVTTTPGTTSYYVTQTQTYSLNPGSLVCESPRAQLKVVVNPLPSAPTVTDLLECQTRTDNSKELVATPTAGNSLQWYTVASGGTASSTTPVINLKNVQETTYYVTQKTAAPKNCESSTRTALKVRVKKLPATPAVNSPKVYCQFDAATALTATLESAATPNWYGNNAIGGTASATAPVPSTAEGGTSSFYVSQTLEGCEGDRAKIDVTINTTPKPTTTTSLAYCQDEVAPPLTATGTNLKWYRTATATQSQTTPFVPITPNVGNFYFYVTQTGTNGCESPKEEIIVRVNSKPSATISGDASIELGQSANIKVDFTGNGPWTYKLSSGITGTTSTSPITIKVTPSVTTTYVVTEVSNNCGNGLPAGSARVTVLIPTISTGNPSVSTLCAGSSFTIPFQQSGYFVPENKFNVQISKDTVNSHFYSIPTVQNGNDATATIPDTTAGGDFYVRVVGENPGFRINGNISPITIRVNPQAYAALTGGKTIVVGETAQLRIDLRGTAPWTLTYNNGTKDSVFTTSTTPILLTVKPTVTTNYQITSVFNQACGAGKPSAIARVQVDPILGVEPVAGSEWLKVYPNPVQNQSTIEITGTLSPKDAKWEIIDENGKPVLGKKIRTATSEADFSNLSEGIYFLRVENGGKTATRKLLKIN